MFTAKILTVLLYLLSVDSNFEAEIQQAKNHMDSVELAIQYAHRAEMRAETKEQLGRVYWMLGILHQRNNLPTNAANYYYGAARIYESTGDNVSSARLMENVGTLALNNQYPEMALRAYGKSLKYVQQADNYQLEARVMFEMGLAYIMHAEYDQAINWLLESMKVLRLRGKAPDDAEMYAKIYNELGVVNKRIAFDYEDMGFYDSALVHYSEALEWSTTGITTYRPLNNIGNVYLETGRIDSAESYFKRALKIGENMGSLITPTVNNLAKIRFSRGDYMGADSLFRMAITLNLDSDLKQIGNGLAIGLNNITELDISYQYLDSLNKYLPSDNRALLVKVKEIHTTQKHLEALELRKQIELNEAQFTSEVAAVKRKENIQRWAERIGLGLLLMAAVAALVWYVLLIRAKKKAIAREIMNLESKYPDI